MKKILLLTSVLVLQSGFSYAENPTVGMPESMKQAAHSSEYKGKHAVDYTAPAALQNKGAVHTDGSANRFGDASPSVPN